MKEPKVTPRIKLDDIVPCTKSGDLYNTINKISETLENAGADEEYITQYRYDVVTQLYDTLLEVTMLYVEIVED